MPQINSDIFLLLKIKVNIIVNTYTDHINMFLQNIKKKLYENVGCYLWKFPDNTIYPWLSFSMKRRDNMIINRLRISSSVDRIVFFWGGGCLRVNL